MTLEFSLSVSICMSNRNLFLLCLLALSIGGCDSSGAKPIPAIVEGDSMAPTVCGAHLLASCAECQCEFESELIGKEGFELTCPNCGFDSLKIEGCEAVNTREFELHPFAKFPRRWEIVGFNLPDDSDKQTGVKRIVGLPGETIEIRGGNLFSNEKVLRKSWELQKEIRIRVFDSKFNAIEPFDNSKRFRAAQSESGWRVRDDELRFLAIAGGNDWLDYVHWRNFVRPGARDEEFPIEDAYGFNQQTTRELNATDDLMIQLDAEFDVESTLDFAFRRASAEFHFEIRKTEKEFLFDWKGTTSRKPLVYKSHLEEELPQGVVEFSSFDRTLMLRINGVAMFELREDETADQQADESSFPPESKAVFRIGGSQGSFLVKRTRIWRDVYYLLAPAGFPSSKNSKLTAGAKEYILLGDNSPKSLDSRMWKMPGIKRSDLIGRLIVPDPSD